MRTTATLFTMGAALVAAAPAPQDLNSIAASLPAYVSELGPYVSAEGSALVGQLSAIQTAGFNIPGVNPTAVVSQLPAAIASNLPVWQSEALAAIPSGILSPAEASEVQAAAGPIFTQAAQELDSIIAQLPQTLAVSNLPGYVASNLASNLGGYESAILAEVSSLIPEASSYLTAAAGFTATATGGVAGATGAPVTGSATKTGSAPIQTFTGAAAANSWGKELVGAAAVVGVVGAML